MVRIQHVHCQGPGSIPGGEMKILQALEHSPLPLQKKKTKTINPLDERIGLSWVIPEWING